MKATAVKLARKHMIGLSVVFAVYVFLTYLVSGNFFFWDTIQLGSLHANFYYDTSFSELLLPDRMDSGHIPAFGMYLAALWMIFGKTLAVSHFALLPFLFGIIFQLYLLVRRFISEKYIFPALILILADPTLTAQSVLISPDIPLVFFFLFGLNAIFANRKILLMLAVWGLFLTSMRGMMVAFALLIFDIYTNIRFTNFKETVLALFRRSIIYLPALFTFLTFNLYHFYVKSWIGYHEDSPWASCFERVGFTGIFKNIIVFGWRLLDFGRIFLWIILAVVFVKYFKPLKKDKDLLQLAVVFFAVTLSLSVSFLLYKNLSGHRYILPVFLIFALITSYLIFEKISSEKLRKIFFVIALIGLLSGNLWVYPEKIAQGWDASLAHVHYYDLQKQMENYIAEQGLEKEDVGSYFPNVAQDKYLYLTNSQKHHPEANLQTDKYIFYSNVFNVPDADIDKLKENYIEKKSYHSFGVFVSLYERKQ